MADSAEAQAAPPGKKSRKKLLIVTAALAVLLSGGGAAAWFMTQTGAAEVQSGAEAQAAEAPVFVPLETFTVNLQGGEQYLQIDITLQVADEAQVQIIKQYMPRVRSRLLALLSAKHADEIISEADKKKLAQDILAQVRNPFALKSKPQQVEDVLFTTFVIQ